MTVEPLTLDFAPSVADVVANTPGRHHHNATSTEKEAAYTVKTGNARGRILIALARTDRGMNGSECSVRCRVSFPHVATTRMSELEALGFARRDGTKRPTSTGGHGEVFFVTDAGREVAARLEIT